MITLNPLLHSTENQQSFTNEQLFPIAATKTRAQIAAEYGVTTRTLHRWMKKNKLVVPSGLLKPTDQMIIYRCFGPPCSNPS